VAAVVDVADAAGNTAPYVLAAGTRAGRAQRALGALPPRRPRVEGAPEVLLEEPVVVVGRGAQRLAMATTTAMWSMGRRMTGWGEERLLF